ncbi:hypothetical protein E2C01_094649 [Portunus trituberculatus]|uniref:Uncharacterized protein n=1 Tax=Portunus trituberculatus TaxID=210409 RepID=A0A5B7K1E6_PORTR|nr:hypothetical protein [Portunus trituberculatus]
MCQTPPPASTLPGEAAVRHASSLPSPALSTAAATPPPNPPPPTYLGRARRWEVEPTLFSMDVTRHPPPRPQLEKIPILF